MHIITVKKYGNYYLVTYLKLIFIILFRDIVLKIFWTNYLRRRELNISVDWLTWFGHGRLYSQKVETKMALDGLLIK